MIEMKREDKEVLDLVHEINFDMLVTVDDICKKHNITYFLCYGALIGSQRHKDFIPWDNDVDLVITREEFDKLMPYLREELDPEKYELVMWNDYGDGHYFDMAPHVVYKKCDIKGFSDEYNAFYKNKANHIALDFFFLDRIPDTFGGKMTIYRLMATYAMLNGHRYSKDMSGEYKNPVMKFGLWFLRNLGKLSTMEKLCARCDRLAQKYKDDPNAKTLRVTNESVTSFGYHFKDEWFDGISDAPIRGRMLPGPKEIDKVLTEMYGEYMTPPPESGQVPHIFNRVLSADLFEFTD